MTDNPITAKMELFCQLSANGHSYSDAYKSSYCAIGSTGNTVSGEVWKLLKDPRISRRIRELEAINAQKLGVTREWLATWHYMRMSYDAAEITKMVIGCCAHCYGDGHLKQWRAPDYWEAFAKAELYSQPLPDIAGGFGYDHRLEPNPDCPKCDGRGTSVTQFIDTSQMSPSARAAFEGIKETKAGIEIKMADKAQAAEALAKLLGFDVKQINLTSDPIPKAEDLAGVDQVALAGIYKRMMTGGPTVQ